MADDGAEVDLYRDTWVRYLGYANEVGEAFRHIVPKSIVALSYGISGSYVLADAMSKSRIEAQEEDGAPVKTFADVVIWQGLASVAIPGFTINRICKGVGYLCKNMPAKPRGIIVTGAGLLAIPFIITPIDKGVDKAMEHGIRPYILDHIDI